MIDRILPTVVVAAVGWASPDAPLTLDYGLTLAGTSVRNQPDTSLDLTVPEGGADAAWDTEGLLRPSERQAYPSLALRLGAEGQPRRGFTLRGLLDTGEIRAGRTLDPPAEGPVMQGLPVGEAAREGLPLREAALGWTGSRASLEIGRMRSNVAGGLVWDDSGTGAEGDIELIETRAGPVRLRLQAVLVARRFSDLASGSALGVACLAVPLSWFESVAPFVAWWSDRDGAIADLLTSAATETVIGDFGPSAEQFRLDQLANTSQPQVGRLVYFGFESMLLPRSGMSLRVAGVGAAGSAQVKIDPIVSTAEAQPTKARLRSWAGSVELHQGLGERWDLGALAVALSGDRGPRIEPGEIDYAGFLAPAPLWGWSGLFFSGGLGRSFYPSRAAAAGVNGHGAVALGPVLSWQDERRSVEVRALWLRALADSAPPPLGGGGAAYGVEVDLRADWDWADWLTVAGEADLLRPGDYFPQDDLALRILLLADMHLAR